MHTTIDNHFEAYCTNQNDYFPGPWCSHGYSHGYSHSYGYNHGVFLLKFPQSRTILLYFIWKMPSFTILHYRFPMFSLGLPKTWILKPQIRIQISQRWDRSSSLVRPAWCPSARTTLDQGVLRDRCRPPRRCERHGPAVGTCRGSRRHQA